MPVTAETPILLSEGTFAGNLINWHTWNTLPRDDAFATKAVIYNVVANIAWFLMFFVVGKYHPLPQSITSKCKPYDKLVLRHRIVCVYHGIFAWAMGMYWHIFINDRTCSKKISDLELVMLANTAGHFIWDVIYMKYHGFLDMGNLIHHIMGIVTYYFTAF